MVPIPPPPASLDLGKFYPCWDGALGILKISNVDPFPFLPPANEVCEGYVFTGVCHSVHGGCAWLLWGGGHAWLLGGHAWLLPGGMHGCSQGGMCGCSWGGVHGCSWGHAWLLPGGHVWLLLGGVCGCSGGHAWLLRGPCVVAHGGHVWLLQGGHAWLLRGACMVAPGGHAWLLRGACVVAPRGVHGCSGGQHAWLLPGACMVARGGMRGFSDEIRSMSGRYASYWNAFLFLLSWVLFFVLSRSPFFVLFFDLVFRSVKGPIFGCRMEL